MEPVDAFALLAPPIPFKTTWAEIATSSAAKLYFVLTSCRRLLDERISSRPVQSLQERKWYLTEKEFEKLLLTSGVDWMVRDQVYNAYKKLDLNHSGFLHISELCATLQFAEEVCRAVINGQVDMEELKMELEEFKEDCHPMTLVSQISEDDTLSPMRESPVVGKPVLRRGRGTRNLP